MSEISTFKSRTGKLTCSVKEFYDFVTDIRNFERFISPNIFSNLKAEKDSLSFHVNILGTVNIRIIEKTMYNKVVFKGETLQVEDFSLIIDIPDPGKGNTEVNITLEAEINPMLKMVAAGPVKRFLETLIDEMEKYKGWKDTKEQNQFL
jgi:carbon monoxide dehydrogenase subunit G